MAFGRGAPAGSDTITAVTDAYGRVRFTSPSYRDSGSLTFSVRKVSRSGWTYAPEQNRVTSVGIALPAH